MNDLYVALKKFFGFEHFLEGQEETIRGVLNGGDSLVVMPTGSGKSMCYQLTALMLEGTTLVVSPLIALMKDQVDALNARGISAAYINSSLAPAELGRRMRDASDGKYALLYVAPERFQNSAFQALLRQLRVAMIAVDEAHCISQWGHDFRPDYLRLRNTIASFPKARVMALTATATPEVKEDIVTQLGLGQGGRPAPSLRIYGFERPNLMIRVRSVNSHAEKLAAVRAVLREWKTGIVYCATRKQVEKLGTKLKSLGFSVVQYHAGLPDAERERVQNRFIQGDADVVVATNAFGMGIDRADVRFVIHWDIPGSVEAYYQEVGRAGRDGEDACCELLYSYADVRTQQFFIDGANPPISLIAHLYAVLRRTCRDEPKTASVEDWAKHVEGGANTMAVNTAFFLLERGGLIQRSAQGEGRTYTVSVSDADPVPVLREIELGMAEKKRRAQRKLDTLIRYAGSRACRHASLLEYFGETPPRAVCTMCDNCSDVSEHTRAPQTEEEWVTIQKILSGVARLRGRFGKAKIAQMLAGSRAKAVTDAGLHEIPTYGALRAESELTLKQLLDELTRDGCIEITQGDYPTLGITERGMAVIRREQNPKLVWPVRKDRDAVKTPVRVSPAKEARGDPVLFEALRAWRNQEARTRGVPAYLILSDRTLHSISARQPSCEVDLVEVWGMGDYKIREFGDAVLAVVDGFLEKAILPDS